MTPREEQFLIAEYNHCWLLINAIDERRGKFLQSITTIVIAAIGAVGFLISETGPLPLSRTLEACALLLFTCFGVVSVGVILKAERKANIRRRKWVNLIRGILLEGSAEQSIRHYLSDPKNKELGIKLPGDYGEPEDLGSTLSIMLIFLSIELLFLLLALLYVLARYCGYVQG